MADQPIGSNEEFMKAAHLIHSNPLAITQYQLRVLRSTHPHFADEAEREQAEARSKLAIEEERRAQQAAETRARQAQALPPVAKPDFTNDNESLAEWLKRNRKHLAPVWLIGALYDQLAGFAQQMNAKNKERNERLDKLESQVQGLVARSGGDAGQDSMVDARLKALESRPAVTYEGVWDVARTYGVGMMVTHSGGIWHAKTANVSRRPGTDPNIWVLAVKSGRDGKDAA
jgi:hypothetical protein